MNYRTYVLGYIQGMVAEKNQDIDLTEELMISETNRYLGGVKYPPMTPKEIAEIREAKLAELERE